MRSPFVVLAGSLLLAACGPGPNVVYVPTPVPTPAPEPVEEPLPPVGVSIVDSENERLLVSTNQPAYVAVFEIVPDQGVSLVYPASPRQRQAMISGSRWLSVWWESERQTRPASTSPSRWPGTGQGRPSVRHVYAIASYRPLRITRESYSDGYLRSVLGSRVYRAANPYETMEALAEHFVPAQVDEDWGEDLMTMDIARPARMQVARVYCPDGSVVYVREDLLRRAVCPSRGSGSGRVGSVAPRPDSVVASTGRRIITEMEPSRRPPIFRVSRPAAGEPGRSGNGGNGDAGEHRNGNAGNDGHTDNGRHTGWTRGRGNNGTAGSGGNGGNADDRGNGNGNDAAGNGESKAPIWSRARPQGNPVTPATGKPGAGKPAARPATAKPDSARPQNAQPDGAKPESAKPQKAQPESAKPQNAKPDSARPQNGNPATPAARPIAAKKPLWRGRAPAPKAKSDSSATSAQDTSAKRPAKP